MLRTSRFFHIHVILYSLLHNYLLPASPFFLVRQLEIVQGYIRQILDLYVYLDLNANYLHYF